MSFKKKLRKWLDKDANQNQNTTAQLYQQFASQNPSGAAMPMPNNYVGQSYSQPSYQPQSQIPQQTYSVNYLDQIEQRINELRVQAYQSPNRQQIEQEIALLEVQAMQYRQNIEAQQRQIYQQYTQPNQGQYQNQFAYQNQGQNQNELGARASEVNNAEKHKHKVFFVNKKNGAVNALDTHEVMYNSIKRGFGDILMTGAHTYAAKNNHSFFKTISGGLRAAGVASRAKELWNEHKITHHGVAVPEEQLPQEVVTQALKR